MVLDKAVKLHLLYKSEKSELAQPLPTGGVMFNSKDRKAFELRHDESSTLLEAELTELESQEYISHQIKEINCMRTANGPLFFGQGPSQAPKVKVEDSFLTQDVDDLEGMSKNQLHQKSLNRWHEIKIKN